MKQAISWVALSIITAFATGSALATTPLVIGGGELDPAFPGADIYRATPGPPKVPNGRACAVARRYVELINVGNYGAVAALYGDDATLLDPMRPSLQGRAQIDEFYRNRIGRMRPKVLAVSYLGDNRQCMVALARQIDVAGRQRYALASVDHFILAPSGRIASMVAFARPPRSP